MPKTDTPQNDLFAQPQHWLITGGTGFIGAELVRKRIDKGDMVTILTRNTEKAKKQFAECGNRLKIVGSLDDIDSKDRVDTIVNLAGEPLFGGPWTSKRKKAFFTSRISTTTRLIELIERLTSKPKCMISGSAIGYYGMDPDKDFTETSLSGDDEMARLCREWEAAAMPAEALGVRLVRLRTGLVLHESGGMLAPLSLSAKLGLAAKLGDGQQWMSWIALTDMVALIDYCAANGAVAGAMNGTAPNPVRQATFVNTLADHYGRPRFLRMPGAPLRWILGGMADLLLGGQKVLPKQAEALGFNFSCPTLEDALNH